MLVFVTYALIDGAIAISGAAFSPVSARFAKLFGAHDVAAVAGHCISVVAAFIAFQNAIATTRRHAGIGIGDRIAEFATAAIRILIACTNSTVAQTAAARCARGARKS